MGILIVYDITNSKSFNNLAKWLQNIRVYANESVQMILLGNKCDMENERSISKEQGEQLALNYGIQFLETSAKTNTNIDQAIFGLTETIVNKIIGNSYAAKESFIQPLDSKLSSNNTSQNKSRSTKSKCCWIS